MFRDAVDEICHWVGGVASCTAKGLVAGAITGGVMGAGLGFVTDPFTGSATIVGTILGALFGAAAGAITCGLTRAFSEDTGRKLTAAAWGAAVGSVCAFGFPVAAQIFASAGAVEGWNAKSKQIARENRQTEMRIADLERTLGLSPRSPESMFAYHRRSLHF